MDHQQQLQLPPSGTARVIADIRMLPSPLSLRAEKLVNLFSENTFMASSYQREWSRIAQSHPEEWAGFQKSIEESKLAITWKSLMAKGAKSGKNCDYKSETLTCNLAEIIVSLCNT